MSAGALSALMLPVAMGGAAHAAWHSHGTAGHGTTTTAHAGKSTGKPNTHGNRGTVKVRDNAGDTGMRNDPHVTCNFTLRFSNFDEKRRAKVSFSAQAPSGKAGETVLTRREVSVSGGRGDASAVSTFDLSDVRTTGLTMHKKHGMHVKVTVEVAGAPGAGKHKVFWVKPCDAKGSTPVSTDKPKSSKPGTTNVGKPVRPGDKAKDNGKGRDRGKPADTTKVEDKAKSDGNGKGKSTPMPKGGVDAGLGGGVDAGLGGGIGGTTPSGSPVSLLLLAGGGALGLGAAVALGRLYLLRRRAD